MPCTASSSNIRKKVGFINKFVGQEKILWFNTIHEIFLYQIIIELVPCIYLVSVDNCLHLIISNALNGMATIQLYKHQQQSIGCTITAQPIGFHAKYRLLLCTDIDCAKIMQKSVFFTIYNRQTT